ncbi:MAG: universal stress protein [Actinomycetes bacterium]
MHALITTDGSEVSLEAARKGVELLNPTKITLLTVADTSIADDSGAGGFEGNLLSPTESLTARTAILDEGNDELSDTVTSLGIDPAIVEHKLVEGSAGIMICLVAKQIRPDVVVVGSHGRGWFKRVVIGSVSEYVSRHCVAPVLVIRHADAADAAGDIPEGKTPDSSAT